MPTSFGDFTTNLEYLFIEVFPFDVIIGDSTVENLQAVIDLGRRKVRFTKDDHAVELSLMPDYDRDNPAPEGTDSEEFTSDSLVRSSSSSGSGNEEER